MIVHTPLCIVPYQPHSRPYSRNRTNTLCAKLSVIHHSTHNCFSHSLTPSLHTHTSSHPHTLTPSHPHTVVYPQEAKCVELGQELAKGKEEVSSLNIKVKWAQNKLKTETETHKV